MRAKMKAQTTVDKEEVERFSALAAEWWNPRGKFAPLHKINPLRVKWIAERAALKGAQLLDIGCGGGLIAEPMARLGARVTAIDASEKNIAVAKAHAAQSGLEIDYRCMAVEALVDGGRWMVDGEDKNHHSPFTIHHSLLFDIVLALEIIEHVADVEAFVAASAALLKPGGLMIYSTLNRTLKSYALAIVGAEYILRWLPRGTHDWNKFLRPHELVNSLRRNNIEVSELTGMVFNPLNGQWRMDKKDLGVNYLVAGRKSPHKPT
jgi:2-polyprenyl-6-hydroxyphenyl methylase/3-demethylubiquinone-9 3-methyltransferase